MDLSRKISYIRALGLPFRVVPVFTVLRVLSQGIALAMAPLGVLVTAYFIDSALYVVGAGLGASEIILPLAALALMQVYGYIIWPLLNLAARRGNMKTMRILRPKLLEKRARLSYKHLEDTKVLDLINRVWESPEDQLSNMLETFMGFIVLVGQTVAYAVILLAHAPLAGSVLIVLSVPMFWIAIKAGKENYQVQRDETARGRQVWAIGWYIQGRGPHSERNLFGYAGNMTDKYTLMREDMRKRRLRVNALWYIKSKTGAIILGILSVAVLFMLAPAVADGNMSVGMYIALLGALFATVNNMGWSLPYYFEEFTRNREYLKEFNQFTALTETPDADCLPAAATPVFERLEFKDVSFTYPGTEKVILDNLNLLIENGKHYAFVGINGAGKTTITKLITRLYDDYTGEILLNGKELRQWGMTDIKAMFCALFQDFARFDVTVAQNAGIGKANGYTDEEIDRALALSGFDLKAEELKDGVHTLLGKTHDDGVDLSGGEWQRLAFARAVISPSPVKILDEPTAALDPVAESRMYAKFEEISRGFTTIYISHRLASAKMADVIYVLDNGRAAEAGNHEALLARGGIYAEMYESQRSWYL